MYGSIGIWQALTTYKPFSWMEIEKRFGLIGIALRRGIERNI
jgi:hypothetical protein